MKTKNKTCRICGNENSNTTHRLTERHFGFYHKFSYLKCSNCGCLQILEYPENIADYYPPEYNAYNKPEIKVENMLVDIVTKWKTQHTLGQKLNPIGWILNKAMGAGFTDRLRRANLTIDDSILDVGTGAGHRLHWLHNKGFRDLTGTDIFINNDFNYENGVTVLKKDLKDITKEYDFIMLNHAFEHMPFQYDVLKQLYNILKPGKFVLIRIPVFSKYMWDTYGDYWIGLEPPRHYYLHSQKSMEILAQRSKFKLTEIVFESSEYQLIGSEQYKLGISRKASNSSFEHPEKSPFSKSDIQDYKSLARKLDERSEGFSACFYLQKPS